MAAPSIGTVDRIVTVALVLILFDGGMHIGLRRIRSVLGHTTLAAGDEVVVLTTDPEHDDEVAPQFRTDGRGG